MADYSTIGVYEKYSSLGALETDKSPQTFTENLDISIISALSSLDT
jgi:hypothetical protein